MQWVNYMYDPERHGCTISDSGKIDSYLVGDNNDEKNSVEGEMKLENLTECQKCKDVRDGIFSLPQGYYRLSAEDENRIIVDEFLNEYEIVRNKDIKLLKDEIKVLNNIIGSYQYQTNAVLKNKKFSVINLIGIIIMMLGGTGVAVGWFSLVYYYIMHIIHSCY